MFVYFRRLYSFRWYRSKSYEGSFMFIVNNLSITRKVNQFFREGPLGSNPCVFMFERLTSVAPAGSRCFVIFVLLVFYISIQAPFWVDRLKTGFPLFATFIPLYIKASHFYLRCYSRPLFRWKLFFRVLKYQLVEYFFQSEN